MPKPIRIIVPEVHDGLGGVHRLGDVVEFENELAELIVSKNMGVIVDRAELDAATKKAADMVIERQAAEIKAIAVARMRVFDAVPPDVRAAAAEGGDDVIRQHLAEQEPLHQIIAAADEPPRDEFDDGFDDAPEPVRRKRGRPRKDQG